VSFAADGLLDTNAVLHAYTTDAHSAECRAFLAALERGDVRARIDPLVVHELSYVLPRLQKQMDRAAVAGVLLMMLSWSGVVGPVDTLVDAVQRWSATPGLAFVDAFLAARAASERAPVYTKNVRELRAQGAMVPDPLPSGPSTSGSR